MPLERKREQHGSQGINEYGTREPKGRLLELSSLPKQQHIEEWLNEIEASDTLMAPLPSQTPNANGTSDLVAILESVASHSNNSDGSSSSSLRPRNPLHRECLAENDIEIGGDGYSIPESIHAFTGNTTTHVAEQQGGELSTEEVIDIREVIRQLASSEEPKIRNVNFNLKLFHREKLKNYYEKLLETLDIPMYLEALPEKPESTKQRIALPKPDDYYGYHTKKFTSLETNALGLFGKYARPSTKSFLPFFAVEPKSQAHGGTLWVAENQNAGDGAVYVHCFEKVIARNGQSYRETLKEDGKKYCAVDSMAFSCCIDATAATLWAHWHEEDKYCSAKFGSYWLNETDDLRRLHSAIRRIIEYGMTTRLGIVKHAHARVTREQTSNQE